MPPAGKIGTKKKTPNAAPPNAATINAGKIGTKTNFSLNLATNFPQNEATNKLLA